MGAKTKKARNARAGFRPDVGACPKCGTVFASMYAAKTHACAPKEEGKADG